MHEATVYAILGTNEFRILSRKKSVELPKGILEATGNNLLLKRPNGFLITAFGERMATDSILRVAEADERYLRAVERQERFGSAADWETVLLFAADVRRARRVPLSAGGGLPGVRGLATNRLGLPSET